MADLDLVMTRVGEGVALGQSGDRDGARRLFAKVCDGIGGERGDPLHRCALAHSMADVQADVRAELLWDRRALEAADLISDERAASAGLTSPVAGFYPSLHFNLGDYQQARHHLAAGQAAVDIPPDDGYARMISWGLERLAERLTAHDAAAEATSAVPADHPKAGSPALNR